MSSGFDKLKDIGAQKIHEQTHISKHHVQGILHETFDDMSRIHFLGFISILEREYGVDLSDLKQKGLEFFKNSSLTVFEETKLFTPQKSINLKMLYILLTIAIFIFGVYKISEMRSFDSINQIDNSAIEDATNTLQDQNSDENSIILTDGNDSNASENMGVGTEENATQLNDTKVLQESILKITPKSKVWMGFIEIPTNRKYQKTFSDEFTLDPKKDWLLLFGHGYLTINANGVETTFKTGKNLRLKYVDGVITKIDTEEFKALNKGLKW